MDIRFKSIKGMNDILPPESNIWINLEHLLREHFFMAGFREIRTPILEYFELFVRGIGEGTDIVEKEMYSFKDKDGEMITLRPEGTAPVVRAIIEHNFLKHDGICRFFYLGPMFRYERPQKGRLRQFHQFGAEVFGIQDGSIDGELIFLGVSLLNKLGVQERDFITKVNSLGCIECRKGFRESLVVFLNKSKDSFCDDCKRRILTNPLRVLDCKNDSCRALTQDAPCTVDYLCEGCSKHFDEVKRALKCFEIKYEIDSRLVRGLDYYSRTTFEIQITNNLLGSQNTVIAGGRYNSLFKDFVGEDYPAIGFAGGIERLLEVIDKKLIEPKEKLRVSFMSDLASFDVRDVLVVQKLREAGIEVEVDLATKSYKSKFKRADRNQSTFAIIKGEDEKKGGYYTVKDLRLSINSEDKQFRIKPEELCNEILRRKEIEWS
ncbi:MAG: histidine--tRNA ligase [Deltaproteobacteria bacterium]|nr:histidine--tRNA ligase [Deltaproteobacteria bacterium]